VTAPHVAHTWRLGWTVGSIGGDALSTGAFSLQEIPGTCVPYPAGGAASANTVRHRSGSGDLAYVYRRGRRLPHPPPIHPPPPSNPIVDGRFWALWAPSHFPAATGLDGLLSPERAGGTRPSSPARPFLLCLLQTVEVIQGEIGPASSVCLAQDLLTVAPIPVERGTPCAAAWHAMRGTGGGMTSDPGYPPTKCTDLVVYVKSDSLFPPRRRRDRLLRAHRRRRDPTWSSKTRQVSEVAKRRAPRRNEQSLR